jgi:hypothetical protein
MAQIRSEYGEEWLPDPDDMNNDPVEYFETCAADTERMDKEAAGKKLVTERIEKKLRRTRVKHTDCSERLRQLELEMKRYSSETEAALGGLRKEVQMAEMDFETRVIRSKQSEQLIARMGKSKMRDESSVTRMKEALDNGDQFRMYHKDGTTDLFFVMIVPQVRTLYLSLSLSLALPPTHSHALLRCVVMIIPQGKDTLLKWGPSIADLRYQADLGRCEEIVYGAKTPELHRLQMAGNLPNPWFTFSLTFPKLGKVIDLQTVNVGSQGDKQLTDWVLALHQLVYGPKQASKCWDYKKLVLKKAFCKIDDFAIRKNITRAQALSMAAYKAQFTPMTAEVKAAMQTERRDAEAKEKARVQRGSLQYREAMKNS